MVAALDAVGATLDDVIKTTLYLADMGDYAEMNAVYNEFFEGSRPARATVQAPLVLPSLLFEMDAMAVVEGLSANAERLHLHEEQGAVGLRGCRKALPFAPVSSAGQVLSLSKGLGAVHGSTSSPRTVFDDSSDTLYGGGQRSFFVNTASSLSPRQ